LIVFHVLIAHSRFMTRIEEFRGLWTRSLITWPDGRRDVSTQVAWVQGPSLFADLRQPPSLAVQLSAASCRDELTRDDCLALAAQQGFAGLFEVQDDAHEWVRRIDYQPKQAVRDVGRLSWRGCILVEQGVETDYTEHWHRDGAMPPGPAAGLWLHDSEHGISGCLLRVGDWFAYARDRSEAVAGETLAELVGRTDALPRMQRLVDCEISLGRADAEGWRIDRSSLPYKVGAAFGARPAPGGRLAVPDQDEAGKAVSRIWDIAEEEGDVSAILDIISQNF
jgi:hypothetical protein